ncbi:MAG: radical SAM protein, partial [Candidatus Aenigmatarchaeota archaeon]
TFLECFEMNDEILSRLRKWKKGKKAPPEKVQIYPTNVCTLDCIFCAQRNENYGYKEELSEGRWFEVVEELGNMNVNRVLISGGGEPFSRANLTIGMMKKIKKFDMGGRLITNGIPLNYKLSQKIINVGWDSVVFSIDGPNAKIHDFLRGRKGSFKKTIGNLKLLESLKDQEKPQIEINFVLTKKNYKTLPQMISLCEELNVDNINFEPLTINNEFDKTLKISKKERQELVESVIPEAEKKSNNYISTNLQELKKIKMEKAGSIGEEIKKNIKENEAGEFSNAACFEPWLWPKIEANGDVWPCSTSPLHENVKNKTFSDIWYGEKFNEFRRNILNGNLPGSCQNCVTTHIQTNNEIRINL